MPTTITSAGVTFTDTTTLTSADGVPSALKLTTARTINGIAFDGTADITIPASGLTSAKAWVNFDGSTSGTWAGGTSTVTRVLGSTTATITTTNAHGLTTGNSVYVLTGVVAGSYIVTVLTSNTFTITTIATTALNAIAITFQVSSIRSQYNVSSVTKNGIGDYTVNFATPMADVNFTAVSSLTNDNVSARFSFEVGTFGQYRTTSAVRIGTVNGNTTSAVNPDGVFVQVFGN
jgi:hypothetical protein